MLGKSCFSVHFWNFLLKDNTFWKYFLLEGRRKVQIMLFEEKSMGASSEPQHSLTAATAHSGHHFPFCIRTLRFSTRRPSEWRCLVGTRQTCTTPLLSSCDSSLGLPTVQVKTRLKNPPDQSTVKIILIFLFLAELIQYLQIASSELLSIISVLKSLILSIIECCWKLTSPIAPFSLPHSFNWCQSTKPKTWSSYNMVKKEEKSTALLDGASSREIQGMKAVKLNAPVTWKEAI